MNTYEGIKNSLTTLRRPSIESGRKIIDDQIHPYESEYMKKLLHQKPKREKWVSPKYKETYYEN